MFNHRSVKKELLDDFSISNEDLRKNLDEMEMLNRWFGSKKVLISALDEIQKKYSRYFKNHKILIGDLGCGNGDLLRAIEQWSQSKKLRVELIGIDANPFVIQYAKKLSTSNNIHYKTENILSNKFSQHKFDIVCLNSVCHHFSDEQLIKLLKHLKKQTHIAIIINDLQRHWLSFYTIKILSRLFNFSALARNDAPLSIMRAFRRQELIQLLAKANITSYELRWAWAFRWKLLITQRPSNV